MSFESCNREVFSGTKKPNIQDYKIKMGLEMCYKCSRNTDVQRKEL